MTYWYRRHVNGWIAMVEPDGQHWNFAASAQLRQIASAGGTDSLPNAMTAADELVPFHSCSEELCGRWNEITVATDVRMLNDDYVKR